MGTAQGERRRWRWGSLVMALLLFAVALAVLIYVPGSPLNRSHVGVQLAPAHITLPPTARPPTSTPTGAAGGTRTPGATIKP